MKNQLFREKSMERVSSPEQLNDYIRVANPSVWLALAVVVFLLIGIGRGEGQTVYRKAANLCMECIGLG